MSAPTPPKLNLEWMAGLEVLDNKIYPLPGATARRPSPPDSRLPNLTAKETDRVCMYEHMATVRHRLSDEVFVAFRQTMDSLLVEQSDPVLFPEWLMKSGVKKTELSIYVYRMKCKPYASVRHHEDWLEPIADQVTWDSVVYYLLNAGVIKQEMFCKS